MFPKRYFAARYFAPRYFPPNIVKRIFRSVYSFVKALVARSFSRGRVS
jgi:hypothetical protein